MIAGAEEAIADFHPNSGVGRPVLIDEAADEPGCDAPGETCAVLEEDVDRESGVEAGDVDVGAFGVAIFNWNGVNQPDVIGESPALREVESVESAVDDVGVKVAVGEVG